MSHEPTPLVDDPEAPQSLRDALGVARKVPLPALDVDAGARRLEDAIKGSPPATPPAGGLHPGVWAGGALVVGLSVALIVRGALQPSPAVRTTQAQQQQQPAARESVQPTPAPAVPPVTVSETPEPPAAVPSPRPMPARTVAPQSPRRASTPAVPPAPPPSAEVAPAETPAAPPVEEPAEAPVDTLRAQIAHLARTRSALARNPAESLQLAEQGLRDYRGGVFEEELEALSVLSLARLHRADEARERGRRFLTAHPRSPFRARIEEALGAP